MQYAEILKTLFIDHDPADYDLKGLLGMLIDTGEEMLDSGKLHALMSDLTPGAMECPWAKNTIPPGLETAVKALRVILNAGHTPEALRAEVAREIERRRDDLNLDEWVDRALREWVSGCGPADPVALGQIRKLAQIGPPQSIMSLCRLADGRFLYGTYNLNGSNFLYLLGSEKPVAQIPCKEAVFRIYQDPKHPNDIYLAAENKGQIFKGRLDEWKFKEIEKLRGGIHHGAFSAYRGFDGKLRFLGGGSIKTRGGVEHVFGNDFYGKCFFEFVPEDHPIIYIPGWWKDTNSAGWLVYGKSRRWKRGDYARPNERFVFGVASQDKSRVLIVGTKDYSGGQHHPNSARAYVKSGGGSSTIHTFQGFDYASCGCWAGNDRAFVGLTTRWKSNLQGAAVYQVIPTVRKIAAFDEAEVRGVEFGGDRLVVATRTDRKRGCVYEVGVDV